MKIVVQGETGDQSLTSLYRWLAEDPEVTRDAAILSVATPPGAGEMGGAFEVINAPSTGPARSTRARRRTRLGGSAASRPDHGRARRGGGGERPAAGSRYRRRRTAHLTARGRPAGRRAGPLPRCARRVR
ncbi:effector-associated constant component EACC1 [Streptomyces bluensis]|uniref:effector-associated constant component EACC1 n=1 Tax=Streptomyces bluensis TaxID=33897 RepID=UPI00332C885E